VSGQDRPRPGGSGPRCWAWKIREFATVFVLSGCVGHTDEFRGPTPVQFVTVFVLSSGCVSV
jgi:hypothetical protein